MTAIGDPERWRRYEPVERPSEQPVPQEPVVMPEPEKVPEKVG